MLGLDAGEWRAVIIGAVVGVVLGLVIHYVESLPTDISYLADLMRATAYVVAFVIFMVGIGQMTIGRRSLLAADIAFVVAAILASAVGPAATPPVQVAGQVELTVDGVVADADAAVCTWAAGREKVERVTYPGSLEGRPYTLDVDRGRLRVFLAVDGGEYIAFGSEAFAAVTGPAQESSMSVPLFQSLPSAPADIPAAVDATIEWTCEAAPAA